ncbi:MAG: M24 family metallopeptidase [Gaiellaceae bacterium]
MPDVLLIGDSERSTELRHEVKVAIGDPFVYAEVGGRRVAIVWSIEGERIAEVDPTIEIVSSESFTVKDILAEARSVYDVWPLQCVRFVRSLGLRSAVVPQGFPVGIADALRADGVELDVDQGLFDDRRRAKSAYHLVGIRVAQRAAESGMAAVAGALRRSEPGAGGRVLDGEPLTCELLKRLATDAFGELGCRGDDLVAAHGAQAANGHDSGSGRVGNDDVVLCDFFPRHVETGCFGDMTRTLRVGAADDTLTAWHRDCVEALELAVSMTRPGVDGAEMNRAVCAFFEQRGHPTTLSQPDGEPLRDGFFHALGHGVGLDVHEAPGIGRVGQPLVAGDVIALEPGLYRQGWGGVRVEDVVLVTEGGCELLSTFPRDFAV